MTMTTPVKRAECRPRTRVSHPRIDLASNDEAVLLTADLPGVPSDGLTVEIERGVLRLQGRRSDTMEYRRALRLPEGLDSENISAALKNGVLTITLPRAASSKPRRIEVLADAPA